MARISGKKKDAPCTSRGNDVGKSNYVGVRNRASPARLVKLYKIMSSEQRSMIEGVGFGGLLNIGTNVLPVDLTKWVISKFEPETGEIVIPGRGGLSVSAETAHKIFGLPKEGDKVVYDFDVEAINFIHEIYQIDDGVAPQIKTIVKRLQDNRNADEDYLRSWLMLVVSTFLCPTTCLGISLRCYPALCDLSKVKELNWCQFVVDSLKSCVHEMQSRNSVKGCLFFLVVLYLDLLDVPNVSIPGGLPRVVAWKRELIDKVIRLDTNIDGSFGKLKIKQGDHSTVQESLLGRMEDIERFVASKVKPSLSFQKKRMLSDAVNKVCIGMTELVGKFLGEVSEIIEGDSLLNEGETVFRRSKRKKANKEHEDDDEEVALDSDYEEEEEDDIEDYEASQDDVSDEEDGDSGADEDKEDDNDEGDGDGGKGADGGEDFKDEFVVVEQLSRRSKGKSVLSDGVSKGQGVEESSANDDGRKGLDSDSDSRDEISLGELLSRKSKGLEAGQSEPHKEQVAGDSVAFEMPKPLAIIPGPKASLKDRWPKLRLPNIVGTSSNVGIGNSWDFSPPDCNVMQFVENDSQQHDAAVQFTEKKCSMVDCSKEVCAAKSVAVEQSTHCWLDDISSEDLDKLLLDAERKRQIIIDGSSSRTINVDEKSEDVQDRTPAASIYEVPTSGIASFELHPKRMHNVPAALRSPFIDYNSKKVFKCSKEVCMVYNVVCRASGRSTRSSQSPSAENLIIINYFSFFVTLAPLSESVKPRGMLINTVAEIGIYALNNFNRGFWIKRVLPLRIATYLQGGQRDHDEVKRAFNRCIEHLDRFQMVLFPVLQTWTQKGLDEKVGHYFLLVLNLRAKRFEVLDSMRSLKDEKLASCCASLVAQIKECWNKFYPDTKKKIDSFQLIDIEVPLQTNDQDCGFHMLMHCEHWDGRVLPSFKEQDMPNIRKLLTYKWLNHPENNVDWKLKLKIE